jgi:transposase
MGQRPGVTPDKAAEIKRLQAQNAELRRANEILIAASAFFAAEPDRPSKRSQRSSTHTARCSEPGRCAES